jgi:hypothetical protein
MFVSFAVHMRLKPYKEPVLERLELLSMSGSVLTLWIGIFFYLGTPDGVEVILSIFIVVFNALLCLEFILSIAKEVLRSRMVKELPPGASEASVGEDALSDHVIFFGWPGVAARRDGMVKSMHAWLLLRLIVWMEHGRRPARQVRDEVPDTLARMQHSVAEHEFARRAKCAAAWVEAGLVADADMAAWLCEYESRGRAPASLDALVAASCARDATMQPYLAALAAGEAHVHEFETEFSTKPAVDANTDSKRHKKLEELSRQSVSISGATQEAPAEAVEEVSAPSQV